MKYGAELSPVNGEPGAMLATGWLTAKSGNQITVGDLDLFDETYTPGPGREGLRVQHRHQHPHG